MSFLLSLWALPILAIGALMVCANIYRFLRHHPRFGQSNKSNAMRDALVVVLVLVAFLAAPQFLVAKYAVMSILYWVFYALFVLVGIRYLVKWGTLILNKEESEGEAPGEDHDCGCDHKDQPKK